jgi:hypothetical protein
MGMRQRGRVVCALYGAGRALKPLGPHAYDAI